MNLRLTEEQQALRDTFAALFAKECTPDVVRAAEPLGHDASLWARMSDIGLLHIGVPEDLGGAGAGLFELVLVAEEAGRRLAPVPLAETVAATRLVGECGAKNLLRLALEGERLVSLPPAPGPVRTQVLADGAVADMVLGLVDGRLVTISRPTDARLISNLGSLPLARWSDATDVEVLADGPGAALAFSRALCEVRVLRAAALVGLAAEAIELGAAYARERSAFGIPIGSYQAVAHPLADALVAKDGAQLLTWKASWALETDHADAPVLARQAFIFAAGLASHAAQHSLHIHGGYGFTEECDIQLYYRRSQAWAATVADPARELLAVADGILPQTAMETVEALVDFEEPAHIAFIRAEAEMFAAVHVTQAIVEEELRTGDGVNRPLMEAMGARGWIALTWPTGEGGADLDPFEAAAVLGAIRAAGGPTIGAGTTMLAANAVRALASEDLKARILPGVAAGKTLICLGFTEPEGGSDVFACKTRAVRDGDEWVIKGQKMFTTYAHRADYCFLLTRSMPGSTGPSGLTMFLVPLDTPGIEIRAVHTMGYERTNIVFYNEVRVPNHLVVGEPNQGLKVIRAALEAEQSVAPSSRTRQLYESARAWAASAPDSTGRPVAADPTVRARLARLSIDAEVADLLGMRVAFLEQLGGKPGPHAALFGPETYVAWSKDVLDMVGPLGAADWSDPECVAGGVFQYHYRSAVASTIYGGSSEVLRSLIAEQSLGLPRSRPRA